MSKGGPQERMVPPPVHSAPNGLRLVLAIGVPLVLVAVLAAVFVPTWVQSTQAQAATDDYFSQKRAWTKAYHDPRVDDLAALDPAAFAKAYAQLRAHTDDTSATRSVPPAVELAQACSDATEILAAATALDDPPPPELAQVAGAETSEPYTAAKADRDGSARAYAASRVITNATDPARTVVSEACAFVAAQNDLDRDAADAWNAYVDTFAHRTGDRVPIRTVERNGTMTRLSVDCVWEFGCPSFTDMDERRKTADAWDTYVTVRHERAAALFRDQCPRPLAAQCSALRSTQGKLARLGLERGEALRTEDPADRSDEDLLETGDLTPELTDASYDYETAVEDSASQERELFENAWHAPSLNEALSDLVSNAVSLVQRAADTIRESRSP